MAKHILVADTSDSDRRLSAILAGHAVVFARTMGEAQRLLAHREFDLVRHVRAGGSHAARPVACVRSHRFASAASISIEGLEIAARALACNLFLDLTKYPDDARGNGEVRKLLDELLTP